MSNWPVWGGSGGIYTAGADTSSSRGTQVFAAGTANTKGSWAEITASTPSDAAGLLVLPLLSDPGGTGSLQILADIGVGGAGSEQVIASNLPVNVVADFGLSLGAHFLPIAVPAGTRLSARIQASIASEAAYVSIHGIPPGPFIPDGYSQATALGVNTSTSQGTQVDPGGTLNTKGSWTEITASAPHDIRLLLIHIGSRNTAVGVVDFLADIGIGGAGSEEIVIENLAIVQQNQEVWSPSVSGPWPVEIPSGTRIAARIQASTTAVGQRELEITPIGIG